jgi:hypothetical protein
MVEVLVAMGLGSIILAGVASLIMYASKSSLAMVNYTDLDGKSRFALDVISREIRQANALMAFQTNRSLTMTNSDQATAITLTYDPTARTLVMSKSGTDQTLLTECDNFAFSLYQRTPYVANTNIGIVYYPATNTAGVVDVRLCKLINLSWKCSRTIFAQKVNTESVQSAQIVLRNKQ